ncbi:uncharacterized protein [Panulirus ornatus]|uniref:uncharacterized protein n=1 Tax=Panulirus ornatus TaxID=150431 RepID=UPI003A8A5067
MLSSGSTVRMNTFPCPWKLALIHPIPKKGDLFDSSNYRPMSYCFDIDHIQSCNPSSTPTSIDSSKRSHFSEHQYGFRKARSIGDSLSYLKYFGESCVAAFEMSKGFDRPHVNARISVYDEHASEKFPDEIVRLFVH